MNQLKLDKNEFNNLFGLTKDQQSAVRSLERAFKKCYDAGIFIHNEYGILMPFNGKYVADITDIPDDPIIDSEYGNHIKSRYNLCSWADDPHFIHLTPKGQKEYKMYLNPNANLL
ncbi:hypothetical protein [Bacteroides sp.]|uniref:hypothetical protein n=1 Tax=Bacteroides sp. TaxID=29523 RepID=UPI002612C0DC|nr:hypothetical protein [Bacteroides sp.]MDD3039073.1 hypothetical protein [Bacteroides sp.]